MMDINFSYRSPVLLTIFWAIRLRNIEHSLPTLLGTPKTNGVKVSLFFLSHVSLEFWLVIEDYESFY